MKLRPLLRTLSLTALGVGLLSGALLRPAYADVRGDLLARALAQLDDQGQRFLRVLGDGDQPQVLVRRDLWPAERSSAALIPISKSWAVAPLDPQNLSQSEQLSLQTLLNSTALGPTRQLTMDVAATTVDLPTAQTDFGLRGAGTVVGVVDTGGDVAHPALRHKDGTTRVRYLLAFGKKPTGKHPELEKAYGCNGDESCAIYDAADLNAILASNVLGTLPKDRIGHGTHITSLAAGRDDDYGGIAPEADLILVAAANDEGSVSDARILLGTRFVFDRAAELAQPAVVNVSLGSNFGAHDGSSAVEQGLRELAAGPGRAVVVAAGNSGQLYGKVNPRYAEPFGSFAEYSVTSAAEVTIPILNTSDRSATRQSGVFLWISTQPGDALSVSFKAGDGQTAFIGPGQAGGINSLSWGDKDDFDVVIVNGVDGDFQADIQPGSVVVALGGSFAADRTFQVVLRGNASCRMWISGTGGASDPSSGVGPLLARASRFGTVAIPGSDPELITVGASYNRSTWTDYSGDKVGFAGDSKGLASFSSAGPNQLGDLKPELIAPGGAVIGAMAAEADPRDGISDSSQFASQGACPSDAECFVVDDEHGVASGTSMAAPIVSGAIALMMQRDPQLTMRDAKRYLMAGSATVTGAQGISAAGTGVLNVLGALLAQDAAASGASDNATGAAAATTRTILADRFVRPGGLLTGYVVVRSAKDEPVSSSAIRVALDGPGRAQASELTPGLWRFTVRAFENTGGRPLQLRTYLGDALLDEFALQIALDSTLASEGYQISGGTCALRTLPSDQGRHSRPWLWLALPAAWLVRRRLRRASIGAREVGLP